MDRRRGADHLGSKMNVVPYTMRLDGFRDSRSGLGDATANAQQYVTPPWWTNLAPGVGPGIYELYQGVELIFAPGDPTPVLNFDNAKTGTLTPDQVAVIKQNAADTITQAAGGNADLAAQQIAQVNQDIDTTLRTQPGSQTSWLIWAGLAVAAFVVARLV
jgi:hypothetical protein